MERRFPALSPAAARYGWWWMAFQYLLLPRLLGLLLGDVSTLFLNFCYHLLCFSAVLLIFRHDLPDCLRWAFSHWRRFLLISLLALAAFYAASAVFRLLTSVLQPGFSNRNDEALLGMAGSSLPLFAVTTVLLAPVSEELLFRGLLFGELRVKSRWIGYLASSLCFCLIHLIGYLGKYTLWEFFLALLQYLPAGLILAWSYEKSQSIAAPIFVHMVINGISLVSIL